MEKNLPEQRLRLFFLEDFYNNQYKEDIYFGATFGILTGLIFVISILGLIGIMIFSLTKRSSEIAIRRVLGGQPNSICLMFYSIYFKQILIAACLAVPISYVCIKEWLASYAFKIDITPDFFVMPLIALLIVTFVVVRIIVWFTLKLNNLALTIRRD